MMSAPNLLAVLLVFYNFLTIRGACPVDRHKADNFEAELQKDLFCAYSSSYRPVADHHSTVNVKIEMAIQYISFDQTEEIFTIHSRLGMTWHDEFLTWDPYNYGGIKEIEVKSYQIWIPRLALINSDAPAYDGFFTPCLLKYNGTVHCAPYDSRSGLCRTWLRNWPYDKQKCTLYFGSWIHSGEQVNFTFPSKRAIVYENFEDGPGWKLLNVTHIRLPGKYHCCRNESYPMLKYIFLLEREAKGIEAFIIVPSIVLLIITMTSLLLDVKKDTRLALQCFTLFGHFLFLNEVIYHLPKQNTDTPIILLCIRHSMVMSLASIALTLMLAPLRERARVPPTWLVKLSRLVNSRPGKYVVFTEFEPTVVDDKNSLNVQDPNDHTLIWMTLANALNSIVFIIYVAIYVTLLGIYFAEQ